MLSVREHCSDNEVSLVGILTEFNVKEGISKKGDGYVKLDGTIRADQEINGVVITSEVPFSAITMRHRKDGSVNAIYDRYISYKEQFISLAAAEKPEDATRLSITGSLEENSYYRQDGTLKEDFRISARYLNKAKRDEKDCATFTVSGVVGAIKDEEKNGEPTGRSCVKMTIINWGGKAHVINMTASGSPKAHIEANWEVGDTVLVTGRFAIYSKTEIEKKDMGFGEPMEKPHTTRVREAVITGGSNTGLEEAFSYDADDIKAALAERKASLESARQAPKSASASVKKFDANDF